MTWSFLSKGRMSEKIQFLFFKKEGARVKSLLNFKKVIVESITF